MKSIIPYLFLLVISLFSDVTFCQDKEIETITKHLYNSVQNGNNNIDTLFFLGVGLYKLNQFEKSNDILESILVTDSSRADVYEYIILNYLGLRNKERAQYYLKYLIKIDSSFDICEWELCKSIDIELDGEL